jgi:hypothetical protein
MHLRIWVGAAIADDDQPVIQIAGVANGRQHDATGVDTGEHQRVDAVRAQQRLQIGANERVLSSVAPRSTGLIKPCRHMIRLGGGTGNAVH